MPQFLSGINNVSYIKVKKNNNSTILMIKNCYTEIPLLGI